MQPLFEHRLTLAGYEHPSARAGGRGTAAPAPARLLRQRRHVAAAARPPGARRPPRGGARHARLRHGRPARPGRADPPPARALRRPPRSSGSTPTAPSCAATRSAAASRCGWPSAPICAWPGWCRWRPPGSTWRAGSRDRARSAAARAARVARPASPAVVLHGVVGEVYKRLAFHRPGDIDPRVARAFASHFSRPRRSPAGSWPPARRLLPELRDPFRLERDRAAPCCWSGGART